MKFDPTTLPARDTYRLMIGVITPRPIAWVSTVSPRGLTNLAPFSFFNGVAASPPTVAFSPVNHRDGTKKDTLVNVEATGEFVVNMVSHDQRLAMNATSDDSIPYEVSELESCGLTAVPSERVRPPRVAESLVQLECVVHQIVPVGQGPLAASVVIGQIVMLHIDDRVLDPAGGIDPRALDTIGRMGADVYTRTTELFAMPRPPGKR